MNWFSRFWSKGRNRAFVYSFGFLIILGSYVIGAPDHRQHTQKPVKQYKAQATIASKSEVQDVEPVTAIKDDSPKQKPVTSTTKVIAAVKSNDNSTNSMDRAGSLVSSTYDPIEGREISEEQQRALQKELHRQPIDYPYEISDEEKRLYEESSKRNLTDKEKERKAELAMIIGPRNSQTVNALSKKQNIETSDLKNSSPSSNNVNRQSYYYPGTKNLKSSSANQNTTLNDRPDGNGEKPSGYNKGIVSDSGRIPYQDRGFSAIPTNWNYTHQFLEIYQFFPGANAGAIPSSWAQYVPVYDQIKKKFGIDMYNKLHDKYRIPPDWDNHWKFSEDEKEEVRISQIVSNKHLLSLGTNGAITFVVTEGKLINGEGFDFVIWSHPNCFIKTDKTDQELGSNARKEYQEYQPSNGRAISGIENGVACMKELAKVYVSADGPNSKQWHAIEPCQKDGEDFSSLCAGYGLNLWNEMPNPFDPASGGDRYDLSDVGLSAINAIKIVDLNNVGEAEKGGFDLDAIAMIHYQHN